MYHASGGGHSHAVSYTPSTSSYSGGGYPSSSQAVPSYHASSVYQSNDSNPWNQFQHDHANQGWTREQMQQKYHSGSDRSSALTPALVTHSNSSNAWNAFQHDNARKGWSPADMQQAYHAAVPEDASRQDAPRNAWNAFQHKHAGQGWSGERMQQEYKRAKEYMTVKTAEPTEETKYKQQCKPHIVASPAASIAAEQPLSWNAFQHAHAGRGWSKAQLSAAYTKANSSGPTAKASTPAEAEALNWNAFQHANVGRHWSRQQMSNEYQAAREQALKHTQQLQDVAKHSEWNAYLHRHKGEGLTQVKPNTKSNFI